MAAITLKNVSYTYRGAEKPAVNDVSFDFEAGRFYAIVGPSGGEQQRVAIARALASGARTLLADEPTGNLDAANTVNVIEILRTLAHERGYCVIVVTHDAEVSDMADEVARVRDGILISV